MEFFSKNGFQLEGMLTSCTFDYLSRDILSRLFILALFLGGFILPFSIIIIFYLFLLSLLKSKDGLLKSNERIISLSPNNNNNNYSISASNISLNILDKNYCTIKSESGSYWNEFIGIKRSQSAFSFLKQNLMRKNHFIKENLK